jgi:flavin-dependent dehydrogenase
VTARTAISDVVVVGGGPAGLAAAIRLRQHGLAVAVMERDAEPRARIGESVPADLRFVLEELGAWPAFRAQGHLSSAGGCSAWATTELQRTDAFCSALGGGWHLDRRRFESMLAAEALRAGAELRRGARVNRVDAVTRGRLRAIGPEGASDARVAIDATGRAATVARWFGARRRVHDRLICAHALFERAPGERRTLVEAVEEGWWYATPLPGDRTLAALFCDAPTFRQRRYGTPARWHAALRGTVHVFEYVGRAPEPPVVDVAAVTPHCLDRAAGPDWIAIGDAASSFDPLSSAGITLAVRDGVQAADAVARYLGGDSSALTKHGRAVQCRFTRYLVERTRFYDLAHRWPAAGFWRQRGSHLPSQAVAQT